MILNLEVIKRHRLGLFLLQFTPPLFCLPIFFFFLLCFYYQALSPPLQIKAFKEEGGGEEEGKRGGWMQEEQLCIHCVNEAIQRDARPGAASNGRLAQCGFKH